MGIAVQEVKALKKWDFDARAVGIAFDI